MKASEYFGDWMDVIDTVELRKILSWISTIDKTTLCPSSPNIFKAFRACPLKDCKVVFLGQDPYPQQGVATGILFGNSKDTPEDKLSPSLQVVKEAAINYEIPHNRIDFDNTLESWAKQGILMINTAFTCEVGRVGYHFDIWKPFTAKLIHNLSTKDGGIIYVLFGNQASSFKKYIVNSPKIIEVYHPAYFARQNKKMPYSVFTELNQELYRLYGYKIDFYKETEYGTC